MKVEAFYDECTNTMTYVVWDPASGDAVIIHPVLDYDPADSTIAYESVDRVTTFVREHGLRLHFVLETHAHADHLSGSQILKKRFPSARTGIGRRITEVQRVFKEVFDLPADFPTDGRQFDRLLDDGEVVEAGTLRFRVMSTPGHTPACVSSTCSATRCSLATPCSCPTWGRGAAIFRRAVPKTSTTRSPTGSTGCPWRPGSSSATTTSPAGATWRSKPPSPEERAHNIQLPAGRSRDDFVAFRTERDAGLSAPRLLFQSVQVNVDAGSLPQPGHNAIRYLKIPINAFRPEEPGPVTEEKLR